MDDPQILADSLRAEAVNSAAVHEEAQAKARSADMHSVVVAALTEVLSDEGGSPLLIKRIPYICLDISSLKSDVGDIKKGQVSMVTRLWWIQWLVVGMVTGIGLIIVGVVVAVLSHALK